MVGGNPAWLRIGTGRWVLLHITVVNRSTLRTLWNGWVLTTLAISGVFCGSISGAHYSGILWNIVSWSKFLSLAPLLNFQLNPSSVSMIPNILIKCDKDTELFGLYQGEHLGIWKYLDSLPKKYSLCQVFGIMGHRESLNHQHAFKSLENAFL